MRDLKALRAFVIVAQQGSVSRAAEALHRKEPCMPPFPARLTEWPRTLRSVSRYAAYAASRTSKLY